MKKKESKINKIGFYLAYPPKKIKTSLRQEGLGRYLTMLLKALSEKNYDITIACPSWNVYLVDELLQDIGVDSRKIEYVTTSKEPIALRIYYWMGNLKRPKKERKGRIFNAAVSIGSKVLDYILMIRSIVAFSFIIILLMVLAVLFLPLAIILCIIGFIKMAVAKLRGKIKPKSDKVIRESLNISQISKLKQFITDKYIPIYIDRVRYSYAKDVVRKINNMRTPADIWYCPTAFWKEFNTINCKKVTCAPDMVTLEFPISFSKHRMAFSTNEVREALKNSDYLITYCNYVKETLLVDKLNKKNEDIIVIPHGVNDCSKYIDVSECFQRPGFPQDAILEFSKIILSAIAIKGKSVSQLGGYVLSDTSKIDLKDVDYIFYASQVRGNKNILNLVKAYEKILREKGASYKLFLTCNYQNEGELEEYIYTHRLQYDVLAFYSVTNQELAALYKCAKLCVNPTYYEGGFPFTFGEGMSVGTPSVMSRIPQVTEVVDVKSWDKMLFDPYDINDMVEKIDYCYHNIDEIYPIEKEIYDKLCERSWEEVAQEYVEAFEYFAQKE